MSHPARFPRRTALTPSRLLSAMLLATAAAACSGDATTGLGPSTPAEPPVPASGGTATPASPALAPSAGNLFAGARLWVDPASKARRTADEWDATRPADATAMRKLASAPQAWWFGNWNANVQADVNAAATTIAAAGALPVFVAYNIPQRDCGGLSGGNSTTAAAYRSWIDGFAAGIGGRRAVVILEPDALAGMDCLSAADRQLRVELLAYAVHTLQAKGGVSVYIDAGNPKWHSAATMASRLTSAGVAAAQGFALNVSNFFTTSDNVSYGQQIAALTGGKHFIVDTGRNGLGPTADNQWCNPAGRALGDWPTTNPSAAGVDAFLWVKTPGESDGACDGAPASGAWMPEYALGLAQRAAY